MQKRVGIVSEFPPPAGGISQQALLLSDLIEGEGLGVQRISINDYLNSPFCILKDIKYIKSITAFFYFFIALVIKIPNLDILHILASSYLNFFLFTVPSVFLAKLLNKKVILHYHGGAAEDFFSKWETLVKWPIGLADHIIVPSEFLYNVFIKYGYKPIIIPNIVNLNDFEFKKRELFRPVFLSVRHLREEYNISCTIRAFSKIKKKFSNATLKIVGDGTEKQKLIIISQKLGVRDSVDFLGRIPNDKMTKIYCESDFLLNSSKIDNMPISILEAFSSGCPVISTRAGGIPYILQHRHNGFLVDLNNHHQMASEAIWALEHNHETIKIVENAKNCLKEFSWGNIKPIIMKLYGIANV